MEKTIKERVSVLEAKLDDVKEDIKRVDDRVAHNCDENKKNFEKVFNKIDDFIKVYATKEELNSIKGRQWKVILVGGGIIVALLGYLIEMHLK